jgi:hypothetical protein
MRTWPAAWRRPVGPAALCRLDNGFVALLATRDGQARIIAGAILAITVGAAAYGFAFGAWRSMGQALVSAAKLPLLLFATVAVSIAANTILAQVAGATLRLRETALCILVSLALSSILLGALSPVTLFFVSQCPPDQSGATTVYSLLLLMHTATVGVCGVAGNVRLFSLLCRLTASRRMAWRILLTWIGVSGLTGCELSWLVSPFLGKAGYTITFWNPAAFSSNFFEYLWQVTRHLAGASAPF